MEVWVNLIRRTQGRSKLDIPLYFAATEYVQLLVLIFFYFILSKTDEQVVNDDRRGKTMLSDGLPAFYHFNLNLKKDQARLPVYRWICLHSGHPHVCSGLNPSTVRRLCLWVSPATLNLFFLNLQRVLGSAFQHPSITSFHDCFSVTFSKWHSKCLIRPCLRRPLKPAARREIASCYYLNEQQTPLQSVINIYREQK